MVIIAIGFVIWLEWVIGKAIGKHVSKTTGIILGLIAILCGFSIIIGIACIIYSQKNRDSPVSVNIDTNANVNLNSASFQNNDTRECPYCAEIIKKKATVCRFCGKTV